MTRTSTPRLPHWPKHFYLISPQNSHHPAHVTPADMGGKAHGLLRMASLGLPVPPALVIGTHYTGQPGACLPSFFSIGLPELELACGQTLGDAGNPLILSVRSGAPVSMPGMMETLLNIGLCDQTLPGLLRQTGNPRMVWDAYRRLIASHGEIVAGLPAALFEDELARTCAGRDERELDFNELRELTRRFQSLYESQAGHPFPQSVQEQLSGAIQAVFKSWHAPKALEYRAIHGLDEAMGTAVTLQRMVFGNTGSHSGAGVGFTRDPSTGEAQLWLDFLVNAQGEDVVSGRRNAHGHDALARVAPHAWSELLQAAQRLEREFGDMQDFEFTVQDGQLFMLQTRAGKRTPRAAARIALDLLDEGLIDRSTALQRTAKLQPEDLGVWQLSDDGNDTPLGRAQVACTGVVSGEIVLDTERAAQRATAGVNVILVRQDAETADIAALQAAQGLLTQRGARTSHAAVVARQLGKVCLIGCSELQIDLVRRCLHIGNQTLAEGDPITLDGNTGQVYAGLLQRHLVQDQKLLERLARLRTASAAPSSPELTT